MEDVKVTRLINGPEAFTPDNEFCLGESEVGGLFVAAGFCAHGLAGAGGIGKVMAEWIVAGEPALDVWEMDIRRFGPQYRSPALHAARAKEVYETYYDIRYPGHERQAGRPLRISSAYAWHREHGAAFGEKSGWERVNWYESNAAAGDESLRPRGWAGMHWSPAIGAEALAHARTRRRCSTSPRSPSSRSAGPGAAELLERLCDNRVAREVGRDHLHADAQPPRRDRVRLHRHARGRGALPDRHRHRVRQPRRRAGSAATCPHDGSVTRDRRDLALGLLRPLGAQGRRDPRAVDPRPARLRIHVDARDRRRRRAGPGAAGHVRRRARLGALLPDRVRRRALADAVGGGQSRTAWWPGGYRAIDSLRLEKGYRVWAADITPDETPLEAGLGFCVAGQGRSSAPTRWREPRALLAVPGARGSALGRARQRAGADRRSRSSGG